MHRCLSREFILRIHWNMRPSRLLGISVLLAVAPSAAAEECTAETNGDKFWLGNIYVDCKFTSDAGGDHKEATPLCEFEPLFRTRTQ